MTEKHQGFGDVHNPAFVAARALWRRGGALAPVCGARTRRGAVCHQQVPIRESAQGRCLWHAGPHAARAHRERQRQAFLSGRISADEWRRAEARRAANRLHDLWKKDPWAPGRTIDLEAREADVRGDLEAEGVDVDALAPAVADWLRWRYRRTRIDRAGGGAWRRAVREALPGRVRAAGPRPPVAEGTGDEPGALVWKPDEAGSASAKRRAPDRPRAPRRVRGKGYGRRGRPRTRRASEDEMAALLDVARQNRQTVGPMLDNCESDEKRWAVLRALRDFQANPNAPGPRDQWLAFVRLLRPT